MRRRTSKRTKIVLVSGLAFLAAYVVMWFPEITLFSCQNAGLLCSCTHHQGIMSPLLPELDDAGRRCDPRAMRDVELRVETDVSQYVGHTYLQTPDEAVGFLTDVPGLGFWDYTSPLSRVTRGHVRDDRGHRYDRVRRYRVGPETLALLQESIRRHAEGPYQLGEWGGGENCATWACARLRDAGLTPPVGDRPNRLGIQMERVGMQADKSNGHVLLLAEISTGAQREN